MSPPPVRHAAGSPCSPEVFRSRYPPPPGDVQAIHRALPGYAPTPAHALPARARALGLDALVVKDESARLGLNAFKALGASHAAARLAARAFEDATGEPLDPARFLDPEVRSRLPVATLTTATDGNHGRAVAWVARLVGWPAVIYIPSHAAPARVQAIRDEGAEVVLVDGSYDATVARCREEAAAAGRVVVADTAWEGYSEIPAWIVEGYSTLFRELDDAGAPPPDLVLLQSGVGSLAAAGARYLRDRHPGARLVCVEPTRAACCLESALAGTLTSSPEGPPTLMAGLDCQTPSRDAWPVLRDGFDLFLAIDDAWAVEAMRALAHPLGEDPAIVSGESGAAGMAGLLALRTCPELAGASAGLARTAWVISTEGATDPASHAALTA